MATITVRNLPEGVQRALKRRAVQHDRSMEAEARVILEAAVTEGSFVTAWLAAAKDLRGEPLPLPERSASRDVDLS
jgi:plasmid stability protein